MNKPANIMTASGNTRFSKAEFVRICGAGLLHDIRLELVDGRLERMTPPMGVHSNRQTRIVVTLWQSFGDRAVVEAGIEIDDETVLISDIAVLRAPMREHRFLKPEEVTLVIEVAETTADRDLGIKRIRYAEAGIAHYWVVDGVRSIVHVYGGPQDGVYQQLAVVPFGEPLAVPGSDRTITVE